MYCTYKSKGMFWPARVSVLRLIVCSRSMPWQTTVNARLKHQSVNQSISISFYWNVAFHECNVLKCPHSLIVKTSFPSDITRQFVISFITTVTIHYSFSLPLQAQNSSFPQILSSIVLLPFHPPDRLHSSCFFGHVGFYSVC